MAGKKLKIAFVVGEFPVVSETFIINQAADLIDRGVEVDIYSLRQGNLEGVSERYFKYGMDEKVKYLLLPDNKLTRFGKGLIKIVRIIFIKPKLLFRIFNIKKYGQSAWSGKLLFWIEPWLGKNYGLIHCHFGTIANKYLLMRGILEHKQPLITTFYGYDVSHIFQQKGDKYYDKLKQECNLFLVMSENMKGRVVAHGFNPGNIKVLPISIDVESYPFQERKLNKGEEIQLMSVGRFVEKKGFDDLLKALAIVREKTDKKFKCTVVGDGALKEEIYKLADDLKLRNFLDFKGYMKLEDVIKQFLQAHLYIQPSKTAKDGDME